MNFYFQQQFGLKMMDPKEVIKMNTIEEKETKRIVIFHKNCADGFSAAWCFYHYTKGASNWSYHGGVYGEDPPDCTDAIVYLVDFSYKREVVEQKILNVAKHVWLIDHHKTAIDDLEPLKDYYNFSAYIDLERSGAMLAWDFLFNPTYKNEPGPDWNQDYGSEYIKPPILLEHVQDRDLWKFKLAGTREISASIFSYEYTFENWDKMMFGSIQDKMDLWKEGAAIERKHFKDIKELVKVAKRKLLIGNIWMSTASLPYTMASDAAHMMAEEDPVIGMAACYYDTSEHRVFSLRSIGDKDVSEIAKLYGGGGHKSAAGFKVPRSHWLAQD